MLTNDFFSDFQAMFFVQRVTSALTMMYNEKEETTLMDLLIGRPPKMHVVEDVDPLDFLGAPDVEKKQTTDDPE